MLIVLLEYIDLFQCTWQHETDTWGGLPNPLSFCIAAFHFKHSCCTQVSIFCSNMLLLCQRFALCVCLWLLFQQFCKWRKNRRIPNAQSAVIATIEGTTILLNLSRSICMVVAMLLVRLVFRYDIPLFTEGNNSSVVWSPLPLLGVDISFCGSIE